MSRHPSIKVSTATVVAIACGSFVLGLAVGKLGKGKLLPSKSATAEVGKVATTQPSKLLDFLSTIGKLKTLKRTGWVVCHVHLPESVADHMYRMGMASLVLQVPGTNKDKVMKLALVHDMAEAIAGDATPEDGLSKEQKFQRELAGLKYMLKQLGNEALRNEIFQLWDEYEQQDTLEAKLVKDYDRLEMCMQALEYETAQGLDLGEFYASVSKKFKFRFQVTENVFKEVLQRRAELVHKRQAEGKPLQKIQRTGKVSLPKLPPANA